MAGHGDISLTGGSVVDGALHLSEGECGELVCTEPNTVYVIFRTLESAVSYWLPIVTKSLNASQIHPALDTFAFFDADGSGTVAFSAVVNDIMSDISVDNYHITCCTRTGNALTFYIDGVVIGSTTANTGNYYGKMLISASRRGSVSHVATGDTDIRFLAFGTDYHDEATVRNYMAYLAKRYLL